MSSNVTSAIEAFMSCIVNKLGTRWSCSAIKAINTQQFQHTQAPQQQHTQWWTLPLGSSFPRRGSSTSLCSFVSCTGWRLQSGMHSNNQSSCTSVYTGLHLHTLLTSFVRWQMSRLVSDSVPVHLHHWLSAAPESLPSVTELSRSPLHVSGTVCQILSLLHLP